MAAPISFSSVLTPVGDASVSPDLQGLSWLASRGEEGAASRARDAFVSTDAPDPRRLLAAVEEGGEDAPDDGGGALGSLVKCAAVLAGLAGAFFMATGLRQFARRRDGIPDFRSAVSEEETARQARLRAELADPSHLEAYEPFLRHHIEQAWQQIPSRDRLFALSREYGRDIDSSFVTAVPPERWATKFARLVERQAKPKVDLATRGGKLAWAMALAEIGEQFNALQANPHAAMATLASAHLFEEAGGRENLLRSAMAYENTVMYADLSDNAELIAVAEREAHRVWIKGLLTEIFRNEQVPADAAEIVSRRVVADQGLRKKFLQPEADAKVFRFPSLSTDWRDHLAEALRPPASELQGGAAGIEMKLADASHLLDIEPGRRLVLIEKWNSLLPQQRQAIAAFELRVPAVDPAAVPKLPPPRWSAELFGLLESAATAREDLATSEGQLARATRLKREATAYAQMLLPGDAGEVFGESARTFEEMPGRKDEAIAAYREAAKFAGLAGRGEEAKAWFREAERAWLQSRIRELFRADPWIFGNQYDAAVFGKRLARRIIEDPFVADQLVTFDPTADDGVIRWVMIKEGWLDPVGGILRELEAGLVPRWRDDIVEILSGGEKAPLVEVRPAWWNDERFRAEVEEVARLVQDALDWPMFRQMYLRDGRITKEGLQEVLRTGGWRAPEALPESAPVAAVKPEAPEAAPVARASEKAPALSEAEEQRQEEAALRDWRSLSGAERKRLLKEAIADLVVIKGEQIAGPWLDARRAALAGGVLEVAGEAKPRREPSNGRKGRLNRKGAIESSRRGK